MDENTTRTETAASELDAQIRADNLAASRILKRRSCETLAEAAQITVEELEAWRRQAAELEAAASSDARRTKPRPTGANAPWPSSVLWASRGVHLRRQSISPEHATYGAKMGNLTFSLRLLYSPVTFSALVRVLSSDHDRLVEYSSDQFDSVEEAAAAVFSECDLRSSLLARELTWGLK